jgi:hypothetical protein
MADKIKISKLLRTCESFPAQWEGRTKEGKRYYFRYRSGFFYVRQCPVTTCLEGPVVFEWDGPHGYAGEMTDEDMLKLTQNVFDWSETKFFNRDDRWKRNRKVAAE